MRMPLVHRHNIIMPRRFVNTKKLSDLKSGAGGRRAAASNALVAQFHLTMPIRRPKLALDQLEAPATRMTHKAKDLSPDQKMAIESLLGRSIAENEEISIRTTTPPSAPEWLQASWKSAKEQGLDQLSMEEIDAEITAARKARRERRASEH